MLQSVQTRKAKGNLLVAVKLVSCKPAERFVKARKSPKPKSTWYMLEAHCGRISQPGKTGLGPHTPSTCAGKCKQILVMLQCSIPFAYDSCQQLVEVVGQLAKGILQLLETKMLGSITLLSPCIQTCKEQRCGV